MEMWPAARDLEACPQLQYTASGMVAFSADIPERNLAFELM